MYSTARPTTFDVSGLPERIGVEVWEQHNAAALVGLSCRVREGAPLRAKEVNLQLTNLHLARVQGSAHAVVRDHTMVARRPSDSIVVYAALRGEAIWEHEGARRVVRPGQLIVCDVDRPFLRGFGHGLDELAVKVPRQTFTELTGLASVEVPMILDAAGGRASPYAAALVRLVGRAVAKSPVPADEQTILELVAVLATDGRVGLPVAHRAAARAFIDDHLTEATLAAAAIAAGAGISERHLSRLFAETGTSVPQHILSRRLDLAHALLSRADTRETRIVDLVAQCGFTSAAYFSETFKRRFGATASAVRRQAAPLGDRDGGS